MLVRPLGWEDTREENVATQSSILAWEIPWAEKPAGYSPWGRKESDMTEQLSTLELEWVPGLIIGFRFSIAKWCHIHTGTSDMAKLY